MKGNFKIAANKMTYCGTVCQMTKGISAKMRTAHKASGINNLKSPGVQPTIPHSPKASTPNCRRKVFADKL